MAIKDLPPPIKTSDAKIGWSQLLDWLSSLWAWIKTPALVASSGNVPTSVTGALGDTSIQIATDEFVARAVRPEHSLAVMDSLASSGGVLMIISNSTII
jgi:hypothetical protein